MSENTTTTSGGAQPHAGPFDPVVIDLPDPTDYAILTEALGQYVASMEQNAENEDLSAEYDDLPRGDNRAHYWTAQAQRARKILEDVEHQLDANSNARRAAGEAHNG